MLFRIDIPKTSLVNVNIGIRTESIELCSADGRKLFALRNIIYCNRRSVFVCYGNDFFGIRRNCCMIAHFYGFFFTGIHLKGINGIISLQNISLTVCPVQCISAFCIRSESNISLCIACFFNRKIVADTCIFQSTCRNARQCHQ